MKAEEQITVCLELLADARLHLDRAELLTEKPAALFKERHAALVCFSEMQQAAFDAVSDLRARILET